MFSLVVALSGAVVFENSTVQQGSYIVKTVQTSATKLAVDLTIIEPNGKLELVVVPQSKARELFGDIPICKPNASILQLNSNVEVHRKILKFSDSLASEDEHTHDINLETQDTWVFMLSNCGSHPVTVCGNASLNSENGFLDERYILYKFASFAQLTFVVVFIVVFYLRVVAGKPFTVSLTRTQKLIIFVGSCIVVNGLENIGLFSLWNKTDERPQFLLILSVITKAAYQVTALYAASQMIMTWKDVPIWPFCLTSFLLLIANLFDQSHATRLGDYIYSSWGFGFHPIFRFWIIYYALHAVTIWLAYRHPRTEDEITEDEASQVRNFQNMLKYLLGSGVVICLLLTLLAKNCAWICYSIEPVFFTALLLIEAHFCQSAKASGWVPLTSNSMGNIPVISNDQEPIELSDGGIPALISASFSSDGDEETGNTKAD